MEKILSNFTTTFAVKNIKIISKFVAVKFRHDEEDIVHIDAGVDDRGIPG